jgi:hypothetical protein
MGEFGEVLVKVISAHLGRELAKYPILINLTCLAIAIIVIFKTLPEEKLQSPSRIARPHKKPYEYRQTASQFVGKFALDISLNLRIPLVLSTLALALAAFAEMPYDFFLLLRVLVFLTCAIVMVALWKAQIVSGWFWLIAGIALTYNPLLPIHLHRETWVWINIATIAIFVTVITLTGAKKSAS